MTLKTKTSTLLALVVSLTLGLTGMCYLRFLERSLHASVTAGLDAVSQAARHSIQRYLDESMRDARALARQLPLAALRTGNLEQVEAQLATDTALLPRFHNGVFLLDAAGQLLVDAPPHPELRGRSYSYREYYQRTVREGRGVVGQPYRSTRSGKIVLTFTQPIYDVNGKLLAVLGCSSHLLAPDALGELASTRIGHSGYLYVYDTTRMLIVHPQPERILARDVAPGANRLFDLALSNGFHGIGETVNSRGVEMLLSLHRIPQTSWLLVVQQPRAEAFASLYAVRGRILSASLVAVALAVLVGVFLVGRITSPVQQLREAVLQLARHLSRREAAGAAELPAEIFALLPKHRRGDELGDLAHTFADMASELNRALGSLQHSVQEWRSTFDSVPDLLCLLDTTGNVCRLNRSATRGLSAQDGTPPREGMSIFQLVGPKHAEQLREGIRATLDTGTSSEMEWTHPVSGRHFATTVTPLWQPHGAAEQLVFVAQDVSERTRAEDSLRESERRYRTLFENAGDAIFLLQVEADDRCFFVAANSAAEKLYGLQQELLQDSTLNDLVAAGSSSDCPPDLEQRAAREWIKFECSHRSRSGEEFPVEVSTGPVTFGDRRYVLAFVRDISERKQAEHALRKSEERFRELAALLPEIVFETDSEGRLRFVNDHARTATGYDGDNLLGGLPLLHLVAPRDRLRAQAEVDRVRESGGHGGREYTFLRRDGSTFLGLARFSALRGDDGKPGLRGIIIDITDRKRLESQLRQASKMEAIGQLAGGIAHDFNNLLTPILGYTEMAAEELGQDHDVAVMLEHVLRAALRAKDLVNQVLIFSRQSEEDDQPVAVVPLVREALKLMRASLPTTIDLQSSIAPEVGAIRANPAQLHQILINLATNASQAIGNTTGTITLSVDCTQLEASSLLSRLDLEPGEYILLQVRDNGPGIDPDCIDRIFDPFFTTKEVGEGSGLGLSVVHGIAARLGGGVDVETTLGVGTVFTVYLPAAAPQPSHPAEPARPPDPGGHERILVVDDEVAVLDFMRQVMERRGYEVVATTSSVDAVERFRARPHAFDLVVTDHTMPGMTGIQLAREVRRVAPDIPIIICTGYSQMVTPETVAAENITTCLMKPVSVRDLGQALRAALQTQAAPLAATTALPAEEAVRSL